MQSSTAAGLLCRHSQLEPRKKKKHCTSRAKKKKRTDLTQTAENSSTHQSQHIHDEATTQLTPEHLKKSASFLSRATRRSSRSENSTVPTYQSTHRALHGADRTCSLAITGKKKSCEIPHDSQPRLRKKILRRGAVWIERVMFTSSESIGEWFAPLAFFLFLCSASALARPVLWQWWERV